MTNKLSISRQAYKNPLAHMEELEQEHWAEEAKLFSAKKSGSAVSVHSKTSCHPAEIRPTVTSHSPTRGYPHEEAPHPGTVASLG